MPDVTLYLSICIEGSDEDIVFDVVVEEQSAVVRQLDWPTAMDGSQVDLTVLSNSRGNLLPRNWPEVYSPIRVKLPDGRLDPKDISVVQSNLIECWSMSWWGFQKGDAAMMLIVETPDDAAYQFDHPPGGPTTIGPRWRHSLGRFRYSRRLRMCFFRKGNYVTLAKRYRRYVANSGKLVLLK
ncbi:MAG TPA: hypothetical protein VGS27_33615, partial [Candidatus Sulfotelmatobacter sp.]|nr:hypothetical protein [Candidatus Sulfotelmatobacter sp.]